MNPQRRCELVLAFCALCLIGTGCDQVPDDPKTTSPPAGSPSDPAAPQTSSSNAASTESSAPIDESNLPIIERSTPPEGFDIDPALWSSMPKQQRKVTIESRLQRRSQDLFRSLGIKQPQPRYSVDNLDGLSGFSAWSSVAGATTTPEPMTDAALEELLKNKSTLGTLELNLIGLSNTQASRLAEFTNLGLLDLNGIPYSPEILKAIEQLPMLRFCKLTSLGLDDAGISTFSPPSSLEKLSFRENPNITDESAKTLSKFTMLKELDISFTGITDEGHKQIQSALPDCKVILVK